MSESVGDMSESITVRRDGPPEAEIIKLGASQTPRISGWCRWPNVGTSA